MIHKLMRLFRTILIGLNLFFMNSCGLFSIDEPNVYYKENYKNSTSKKIDLVFFQDGIGFDTVSLSPNSIRNKSIFAGEDENPKSDLIEGFARYNVQIHLISDTLVQIWQKPTGYFGDNINTPFNYDSWIYEILESDTSKAVGQITFTITEEDLKKK
jgi:hypothetical protein